MLKKQQQGGDASIVASSSNNLAEVLTISSSTVDNEWIMNFGCSFHMFPNIEWFKNFCNRETKTVYMGNNQSCCVQGIGDISFKVHDNRIKMLTNVRYVPRLKRNIISLGTLDELGYSYKAENEFMHVFKDKNLILIGTKKHSLYVLNGYSLSPVNISTACMAKADKIDL